MKVIECTRWELLNSLMTGGHLNELDVVNKVEREDGSNSHYNVTGIRYCDHATVTLFAKVRD